MQIQYAQNNSGSGQLTTGSFADFLVVPITTVGVSSTVQLSAVIGFQKGATGNVNIQLLWDGVAVAETVVSATSSQSRVISATAIVPSVSSGSHTAKVQIMHNTVNATVGGTGKASSLVVIEW